MTSVRIDKWLWAARFYKTRQLAIKAIKNGKIGLNGQRIKPSSNVKLGDSLSIKRNPYLIEVVVRELSEQRGPAKVAQMLYQETEQSKDNREKLKQQISAQPKVQIDKNKPDRRAVRANRAIKRGQSDL